MGPDTYGNHMGQSGSSGHPVVKPNPTHSTSQPTSTHSIPPSTAPKLPTNIGAPHTVAPPVVEPPPTPIVVDPPTASDPPPYVTEEPPKYENPKEVNDTKGGDSKPKDSKVPPEEEPPPTTEPTPVEETPPEEELHDGDPPEIDIPETEPLDPKPPVIPTLGPGIQQPEDSAPNEPQSNITPPVPSNHTSGSPSTVVNSGGYTVDSTATTTFLADAPVEIGGFALRSTIPKELIKCDIGSHADDIKEFLSKPYNIYNGVFQASDTSGTFTKYDYFYPLAVGTGATIYLNKLQGIWGMRADLTVKLIVNANRFQAGRYMIVFIPTGGATCSGGASLTLWQNSLCFDKTRVTQLPHVEIDLGTQSEAILTIPYISGTTHWVIPSQSNNYGSPGAIQIYPYSPLNTTAAAGTSVPFQMFFTYSNISFNAMGYPQMDITRAEQKSKGVGPVSSVASTVSKVAGIVGDHVPQLSSITKPLSWVADLVKGVATHFGYSNPVNLDTVPRNSLTWFPYMLNCDNIDNSMPASLFSRNEVQKMSGVAGTDIDEASFDFIKQVPAYYNTYTLSTADSAGTSVFNIVLEPATFVNTYNVTGNAAAYTYRMTTSPPFVYLARHFYKYRGGFRFKFKFVKTEFHSGRFAFVFQPYSKVSGSSTSAITYANTMYCHRHIIDIRECNEFEIKVPYTAVSPYLPMWGATRDGSFGYLSMYVVNPIVCPSTVATSISVIVEVCADKDFELAYPRYFTEAPVLAGYQQMGLGSISNEVYIGSALGHNEDSMAGAKYCVGEQANSVYQLLKSGYKMYTPNGLPSGTYLNWDPFTMGYDYCGSSTTYIPNASTKATYNTTYDFSPDNFTRLCSMYLFNRGGMRLRLFTAGTATQASMSVCTITGMAPNAGNYYRVTSTATYPYDALSVIQNQSYTGGTEIQIPNYGSTFVRATSNLIYNTNRAGAAPYASYTDAMSSPTQVVFGFPAGAPSAGYSIVRTVSDDFQLFGFIGAPLVGVPTN